MRQILLDPVFSIFRAVAHQRTVGVLGRLDSGGAVCGVLAALSDRLEHLVADHVGAFRLGPGQEAQAIRLEHDLFGDQELLAPVPLLAAVRLSNR